MENTRILECVLVIIFLLYNICLGPVSPVYIFILLISEIHQQRQCSDTNVTIVGKNNVLFSLNVKRILRYDIVSACIRKG